VKIADILADHAEFKRVCEWLYSLQGKYDASDYYACSPDVVLRDDMYAMVDLFEQALGREMLANYRDVLEHMASPSKESA